MVRMTSNLSDVKSRIPAPKDKYLIRVKDREDTKSKPKQLEGGRMGGGNPMCVLTWEITEGPYMDKEIRFDNLILSGKNDKGLPITPFQLCQFLDATGTPWMCKSCKNQEIPRRFYFGQGVDKDGFDVGKPLCPDCKSPKLEIEYDTDNFIGAKCYGLVDVKKADSSDDEYNTVKKYIHLEDAVA